MNKMINGESVELNPTEEAQVRAGWQQEEAKAIAEGVKLVDKRIEKVKLLDRLNVSEDEWVLLLDSSV